MTPALKFTALAVLIAATQAYGTAYAEIQKGPATTTMSPNLVARQGMIYTPVLDEVGRRMVDAHKALDAGNPGKAAADLRVAADELKAQSSRIAKVDKARAQAEIRLARNAVRRMDAAAKKVDAAAAGVEAGRIKTIADLDKAIDRATRADMERRWLVTDVTAWYPASEQPQRHFLGAVKAFARKDSRAAAVEIHKAAAYVRLEADQATGDAKQALNDSIAELDQLAASVANGTVKDENVLDKAFADADHALAMEQRAKAAESWARKQYNQAGYELEASAHGLENAAGWIGGEAKAGAATAVDDGRALGNKLVAGGAWTRNEVARGFESLGSGINALGREIGSSRKTASFNAGA